ncbi:hypothetical protein, partial [Porphyromonas loveana]|uniref:hypothetical protein n=1 Tax=Porphyromonas loveana TaxID=1884669 RepID=UPI00359F3F7E
AREMKRLWRQIQMRRRAKSFLKWRVFLGKMAPKQNGNGASSLVIMGRVSADFRHVLMRIL